MHFRACKIQDRTAFSQTAQGWPSTASLSKGCCPFRRLLRRLHKSRRRLRRCSRRWACKREQKPSSTQSDRSNHRRLQIRRRLRRDLCLHRGTSSCNKLLTHIVTVTCTCKLRFDFAQQGRQEDSKVSFHCSGMAVDSCIIWA